MASKYSGKTILTKLLQIEEGVRKHGSDPSFPDLSRICNIDNTRALLADRLMAATASKQKCKEDFGAAQAMTTQAGVSLEKLVFAIKSWAGRKDEALRDFGLKPHKAPRKRKTGAAAGSGHTARKKGGSAYGAAGGGGGAGGTSDAGSVGAGATGSGAAGDSAGSGATTGGSSGAASSGK